MGDVTHARPALEDAVQTLRSTGEGDAYHLGHALQLLAIAQGRAGEQTRMFESWREAENALERSSYPAARSELVELRAQRAEVLACAGNTDKARDDLQAALQLLEGHRASEGKAASLQKRLLEISGGGSLVCPQTP